MLTLSSKNQLLLFPHIKVNVCWNCGETYIREYKLSLDEIYNCPICGVSDTGFINIGKLTDGQFNQLLN